MKISVICPLYNSLPHLKGMIDSLRVQTMSDFEVIIVDDHSTDDSLEVAKDYTKDDRRFHFLQTPKNSGPGVARNMGIEAAVGEYIAFIDSDDSYHPEFLERLTAAACDNKDLTYCQLQYLVDGRPGSIHHNPVVQDGVFTAHPTNPVGGIGDC